MSPDINASCIESSVFAVTDEVVDDLLAKSLKAQDEQVLQTRNIDLNDDKSEYFTKCFVMAVLRGDNS